MSRLKTQARNLPVPQDETEANETIARIGKIDREVKRIEAGRDDELARIKDAHGQRIKPLKEEREALLAGLETWAAGRRRKLLKSGRKSVRMPAGEFGWRLRPPRVTVSSKVDVIAELQARRLKRFIRVTRQVNREAIREEPQAVADVPGIKVGSAGETFWVEPFYAGKLDA